MVVARSHETEHESLRGRGAGEVADRQRILRRVSGLHVVGRREAVAALTAVFPILDRCAGNRLAAEHSGVDVVLARFADALLAFVGGSVGAARADDLPGAPAARLVILRRRGANAFAARVPARVPLHRLPITDLLGVAVTRVDLEELLLLGSRQLRGVP